MSPSHIEALTVIAGLLYNFTYVKMKRPNKNPLKRKTNRLNVYYSDATYSNHGFKNKLFFVG